MHVVLEPIRFEDLVFQRQALAREPDMTHSPKELEETDRLFALDFILGR